jgi:hypothetical protein
MPSSRSGSPPITLPPLKLPSALLPSSHRMPRSPKCEKATLEPHSEVAGGTKTKPPTERLPGFSEFAAASCPSSTHTR